MVTVVLFPHVVKLFEVEAVVPGTSLGIVLKHAFGEENRSPVIRVDSEVLREAHEEFEAVLQLSINRVLRELGEVWPGRWYGQTKRREFGIHALVDTHGLSTGQAFVDALQGIFDLVEVALPKPEGGTVSSLFENLLNSVSANFQHFTRGMQAGLRRLLFGQHLVENV